MDGETKSEMILDSKRVVVSDTWMLAYAQHIRVGPKQRSVFDLFFFLFKKKIKKKECKQ